VACFLLVCYLSYLSISQLTALSPPPPSPQPTHPKQNKILFSFTPPPSEPPIFGAVYMYWPPFFFFAHLPPKSILFSVSSSFSGGTPPFPPRLSEVLFLRAFQYSPPPLPTPLRLAPLCSLTHTTCPRSPTLNTSRPLL